MKTADIRRRFLVHFGANGHTVVPGTPLAVIDEPAGEATNPPAAVEKAVAGS